MLRKLAGASRGFLDDVTGNSKFTISVRNDAKASVIEFSVNDDRFAIKRGQTLSINGRCKCRSAGSPSGPKPVVGRGSRYWARTGRSCSTWSPTTPGSAAAAGWPSAT